MISILHFVGAKNLKSRLTLIILAIGISGIVFAPIFMRLSELGPNATALYRVLFALPFLLLWLSIARLKAQRISKTMPHKLKGIDWGLLILSGIMWSGDLIFWHWSIQLTSVANATFFACSSPIFVIIGASLFFQEHVSRTFIIGFILTLLGGTFLIGSSVIFEGSNLFGDLFGIVTALFFGAYLLIIKHLRIRLPAGLIMFWSGVFSLPGLLAATIFTGESFLSASLTGWSMIICLAILAQVLGQGLATYAIAKLPVSFTSVAFLGEPVVAAILGWLILSESLSPLQIAGCIIILFGLWLVQRFRKTAK